MQTLSSILQRGRWWLLACVLASASLSAVAAPPAGSTIGNQATVTYTDYTGNTVSVSSNLVQSTVAVVYVAPIITGTIDMDAQLGVTVNLPFTITNASNTEDAFDLSLTDVAGGFGFDAVTLYADTNADGIPDSDTPYAVGGSPDLTLPYEGSASFVAVTTLPNSGSGTDQVSFTGQSSNGTNLSATDTSTVTIQDDAQGLINASIGLSNTQGTPDGQDNTVDEGTQYTVSIAYENTGDLAITALTFSTTADSELLPTGMRYISGSESGADTFIESANDITATVNSVAAGASGIVSFAVKVPTGTPASQLTVQADYAYTDAATNPRTGTTNQVPFTVLDAAAVTLTDTDDNADGDGDATIATVASGVPGSFVDFELRLTNDGNDSDRFDITVANTDFPSGVTFTPLGSDGATPLTDSNGNGIVDVGPLAAGATATLFVRAQLPGNASGTDLDAVVSATSITSSSATDDVTLTLSAIADAADVDLEGSNGGGRQGDGAGTTTPVDTLVLDAANQGQLRLFIANTGSSQVDLYDLATVEVGQSTVPAGWDIRLFRDLNNDGVVDDGEPLITMTDTLIPGAEESVVAVIDASTATTAGSHDLVFSATSTEDGTTQDVLAYTVTISTADSLAATAPVTDATTPVGQSVEYSLTLVNNGNQSTGAITLSTTDSNVGGSGFTSLLFPDTDCDGTADGAATTSLAALAAGASTCVLVQVSAPADADGAPNVTTVTITPTNGAATSLDFTTETEADGFAVISKRQSADDSCDGTADGPFGTTVITVDPGNCIVYEVVLTATQGDLTEVVINDQAPAFSSLIHQAELTVTGTGASSDTISIASPPAAPAACDATNANRGFDVTSDAIAVNVCNLEESATATLMFRVQVEP